MNGKISKIVILGGGTAGWMTAAALSKTFSQLTIQLIESESIGTIGVGEATIPTMVFFNNLLGISEEELLQQTQGTYKLGIAFENWSAQGSRYIHAFGSTGTNHWAAGFHNFWKRARELNIAKDFSSYNLEAQAAEKGIFSKHQQAPLNYAFHIDANRYAALLRSHAEQRGVSRLEGLLERVNINTLSGEIESLTLQNGETISGDLFIDCSGFNSLLIGKALKMEFISFSEHLLCDSAIAVQTQSNLEPLPYTRSIAHKAGWRWRIPLQHRVGNGLVYSSRFMSEDEATALLMENLDGPALTSPKSLKFETGYRKYQWHKNCVAVGLAGGFIEPLESTAIHLIQQNILKLIKLFPSDGLEPKDIAEFNSSVAFDYQQIRDFIVLHYHLTQREDSAFWLACKYMTIPSSLQERLSLFKSTGRFFLQQNELFIDSWFQVMIGQGLIPEKHHRLVEQMPAIELAAMMNHIENNVQKKLSLLMPHHHYLKALG